MFNSRVEGPHFLTLDELPVICLLWAISVCKLFSRNSWEVFKWSFNEYHVSLMLLWDDIGIQISIKQESRCWVYWLDICWIRIWAGIIIRTPTHIWATRDQYYQRHTDASADVKFNLIRFQEYPVPFESRSKADGERIYHFLITSEFVSQGEGWDLFIYALINFIATYGLFWILLAVRQEYCNNLWPLVCNNCSPFAPPSNTWIYKLWVTFQLVLFSPQGSSEPWLRLTQECVITQTLILIQLT